MRGENNAFVLTKMPILILVFACTISMVACTIARLYHHGLGAQTRYKRTAVYHAARLWKLSLPGHIAVAEITSMHCILMQCC